MFARTQTRMHPRVVCVCVCVCACACACDCIMRLQQLAHLPPKIDYKCCRGDKCNAPQQDAGACFVSETTLDIAQATSSGNLPGHVQVLSNESARGRGRDSCLHVHTHLLHFCVRKLFVSLMGIRMLECDLPSHFAHSMLAECCSGMHARGARRHVWDVRDL